jgi:hypothetical protein
MKSTKTNKFKPRLKSLLKFLYIKTVGKFKIGLQKIIWKIMHSYVFIPTKFPSHFSFFSPKLFFHRYDRFLCCWYLCFSILLLQKYVYISDRLQHILFMCMCIIATLTKIVDKLMIKWFPGWFNGIIYYVECNSIHVDMFWVTE